MAKKAKKSGILLSCSECKRRNYITTKSHILEKERLELKKFCPYCRKHTLHREMK